MFSRKHELKRKKVYFIFMSSIFPIIDAVVGCKRRFMNLNVIGLKKSFFPNIDGSIKQVFAK